MKTLKLVISCLGFLFILAFSKESLSPKALGSTQYAKLDYSNEEIFDSPIVDETLLKNTVYSYLHETLQHQEFRDFLVMNLFLDKLSEEEDQHPECIIAKNLSLDIQIETKDGFDLARSSTCTLEDIMMQWVALYNPEKMELFHNLLKHYPDLTIQCAWWSPDLTIHNGERIDENNSRSRRRQSFFHEDQKEMTHQKRKLKKYIFIWFRSDMTC
jgi:hypothetical protein